MASGRHVRHCHVHRHRDRPHQNVLLHVRQNVVDSWTGFGEVPNKAREAREGLVVRHEVDAPAAMWAAEGARTVAAAPVSVTHWRWSQHWPILASESAVALLPVPVAHSHWSQHSPIPGSEFAAPVE